MTDRIRRSAQSGVCLSAMVLTSMVAVGQANPKTTDQSQRVHSAGLKGKVVTPSGLPIKGAAVTLDNAETHIRMTILCDPAGEFVFPSILPGTYRMEVIAKGYRTFLVTSLPLVDGDAATANARLEPGATEEIVVGTSTSVTSKAGTALANKSVSDLPENQRNFVNLVQVSAGANEGSTNASSSGSRPGAQHDSSAVSIGGQPETTNYHMIDGLDNNERINSQVAVHPSVEGIAQVQVYASAYPAQQGKAGGGVVNVQTKSGTDNPHGSLYEYFRNDKLDAFPFQFGARNPKPELRQNQFGGSLSGPIIRNRTHFMVDYEEFRLVQGRAPLELKVPTAFEHNHPGDFSDVGGPVIRQLDSAGLAYFKLYPLPNVPGSTDQFVSAPSGSNLSKTGDVRIDQQFSEHDQFFSRFSLNRTSIFVPGQFPSVQEFGLSIEPSGSLNSYPGTLYNLGANGIFGWTHNLGNRGTLELHAGYLYSHELDKGLNPDEAVNRAFGQSGINISSSTQGLAPVNVLAASALGSDGLYRPLDQTDSTFQYTGTFTRRLANHELSVGGSLIRRNWHDIGSGSGLGSWNVLDLPSLLRGQFLQVTREVDLVDWHMKSWEPSVYLEDNWKASENLALEVGLRYDIFTPPTEENNRVSNFDPSSGKIVVAGVDGVSSTAGIRTDFRSVGPRLGLNWLVRPQTTLRAGFGIVYFRPLDGFAYQIAPFAYSFGTCSSLTCPGGYTSLAAGLPMPSAPDYHHPAGNLPYGARSFHERMSSMQQFNLGIEHQFAGTTVRAFYVGALGRHIARYFPDLNAPPPNTAFNPNGLRPYHLIDPELAGVGFIDTEASSSYHALQATLAREVHGGLTAQINYSLAHSLDNSTGQGLGTVPSLSSLIDYGNSSFDVRQRIAATLFYELPFAKNSHGIRHILLGGWQSNLAGVWSTGLPYTILNASDVSNTNPGAASADRPDQVGRPTLQHPGVSEFFDVSAFRAQAPGTLGTERSNQLQGPSTRHVDASLFKTFQISKDRLLQFRTEVFNVTNTANFGAPAAVLGGANFGRLTQLTAGYSPREIQFALRLQF